MRRFYWLLGGVIASLILAIIATACVAPLADALMDGPARRDTIIVHDTTVVTDTVWCGWHHCR